MPRIKYQDFKFKAATLARIDQANTIIAEYQAQGYDLTLRQLFYQFVSRDLLPNNDREYSKLGDVIANARMAGLIDWEAIVDRTRFIRENSHWFGPDAIVRTCSRQFQVDKWADQPTYIEVFVEKDALIGVLERVCKENDVPYLACRGYASASEIWRAGHERLLPKMQADKQVTILYLGDHDPSGIDMTRDIRERLNVFTARSNSPLQVEVERLALNMDQVELYNPPPNPTKLTDSRAEWYIDQYGESCWELDALDPVVISDLIRNAIESRRDDAVWNASIARETAARASLAAVADQWGSLMSFLE